MNNQEQIDQLKGKLDTTKSVFVLLPQNPSFDATAAALSLFLSLKESGKNVFIGCPTPMRVEYKPLVGLDRISEKIGNRNLIIAFDYAEDAIEKVSYNVEEGKFNLVIEPKSGHPPLDTKGVEFAYEGIEAQLMFIIGAKSLEDLGGLYEKNRQSFNDTTIVNLDNKAANTKFGQVNLVNPPAAAISEVTFQLMRKLSLPMNVDIAGNLLKGIEAQTQNLQAPFAGPDTFEAVAELMRAGAKRRTQAQASPRMWAGSPPPASAQQLRGRPASPPPGQKQFTPPPPQSPSQTNLEEPRLDMAPQTAPLQSGQKQTPAKATEEPSANVSDSRQKQSDFQGESKKNQGSTKQEEWLKPKIYKGSTKI